MRHSKPSVGKKLKHWIKADGLCALYDQLNEVLFEGVLPSIPCYINPKLSRCLGRCLYVRSGSQNVPYAIDLSPAAFEGEFFDTFIHEMVHVWQGAVGRKPNHDSVFKRCLRTKKQIFDEACNQGRLINRLPEGVTALVPRSGEHSRTGPSPKRGFPRPGWRENPLYVVAFNEVNDTHFNGLLPFIPMYENPRLTRSICRLHMRQDNGELSIAAGDVQLKVSKWRLKRALNTLLRRCLEGMLKQKQNIAPHFGPAIEHIRSHRTLTRRR